MCNLQEPETKEDGNGDFLPRCHLQAPERWHRKENDDYIKDHANTDRRYFSDSDTVSITISARNRIPRKINWMTPVQEYDAKCDSINNGETHQCPSRDLKWSDCKDASVEPEDRVLAGCCCDKPRDARSQQSLYEAIQRIRAQKARPVPLVLPPLTHPVLHPNLIPRELDYMRT